MPKPPPDFTTLSDPGLRARPGARLTEPTRPRERLLLHGSSVLTDDELLALLLRTGSRGQTVHTLAQGLLAHFSSLRAVFAASPDQLMRFAGMGQAKVCQFAAVLELARRIIEEDLTHGETLDHPQKVKQYCQTRLSHCQVEHCIALFLDTRLRLIGTSELARGTLSQASVYPREVVREALRVHAAALIIAHNHPSGWAEASSADCLFTRHLQKALSLIDVRLVDHLIVAGNRVISMAEAGTLTRG